MFFASVIKTELDQQGIVHVSQQNVQEFLLVCCNNNHIFTLQSFVFSARRQMHAYDITISSVRHTGDSRLNSSVYGDMLCTA